MNNQSGNAHSQTSATETVGPPAATGMSSTPKHGGATGQSRPVTEFHFTRRRLPHWQSPGEVYCVTFRTVENRVLQPQERNIALAACRFWDGKKIELYAAVVMPDHVHLLLQPRPVGNNTGGVYDLAEVLHSIKSFSAHQIAKRSEIRGAVWQHESYDRIIRDEAEFDEKWTYICNNAVTKKLAREPGQYPWFWYHEMKNITATSETLAPPSPRAHETSGDGATVPVTVVKPSNRS